MADARGLSCPMPVVLTRRAMEKDSPASLEVLLDSQTAVENVTRFAQDRGYQVTVTPQGGEFKLDLKK